MKYNKRKPKIKDNRRENVLKNYSEGNPRSSRIIQWNYNKRRRKNILKIIVKEAQSQEGNKAKQYNKIIAKKDPLY